MYGNLEKALIVPFDKVKVICYLNLTVWLQPSRLTLNE